MGFAGAAVVIRRKQRDTVYVFQGARAMSPDTARDPDELGVDQNLAFDGLVRRAILRDAGHGRYYLDQLSWNAYNSMRRRLALVMLAVMVTVAIAAIVGGVVNVRAH